MKDIENLKPFPRFCHSIGYIPASYKVAMTYEEQLFWFCDYLENTIIPTINQNGEAVEELQNLYIELKNYVDNYFENLDVQQEIDNKLDEMAESGQLADIITAYLQLRCIYGFDTISDMAQSTNLIDGSYAKTYGKLTTFDGLGAFYKVREIINTDVIDGDNIVALADPTLVAQKIFDKNFNDFKDDTEYTLDIMNSKVTIMIGDSYAVGNTQVEGQDTIVDGWCEYLKSIMGLSNAEYFKFAEGGIGFADSGQQGHTGFLDLLQDNIASITNKPLVKNIIVCAGYNDANQSFSAIDTAIYNFITYCKTQFPNATVYIGMVGNNSAKNDTGRNFRRAIRNTVIPAYTTCRAYGAVYLNGVENVMKYYPNMSTDTIHPTASGYRILAQNIYQAFKNGKTTYILPEANITWDDSTNINFGNFTIKSQIVDNMTQFKITSGVMSFDTAITFTQGGYIDLGAIDCKNFRFTDYGDLAIPIFCGVTNTSSQQFGGLGLMTINNSNHLIIGFRPYKNDGTGFSSMSVHSIFFDTANQSIPTLNC